MILKFQLSQRQDKDFVINVSSEQMIETQSEADDAGASFYKLYMAFLAGWIRESTEAEGKA